MPLDALNSVAALSALSPAVQPSLPTSAPLPGVPPTTDIHPAGGSFGAQLAGQVDALQAVQGERDTLSLKAVTGDLEDIHQATIAAAEASATMDLMVSLRNSGLQAFNELMRIQA
ncbi:flagellar hook-basal body complex protein FliE [Citricoccus sp. GCM10030269]|uniref:flagellar hook-basal body complex protein FliE n=1 Tax=Citricoccus sp. GCM10030269 TaxID=3273388 RepID=UPI0036142932